MARYEHSGNAQDAHLVGNLTSSGLGLTIDSASGWPTASTNKFWIAIDPDTASEEHILVNVRTGTALTIASIADRGLEGTAAVAHTTGAVVRHIFSATEATDMALQSVTNTFTAAQNVAGANITAQYGTSGVVSMGSVGGGGVAGIGIDASNYFGKVDATTWDMVAGGTVVLRGGTTGLKSVVQTSGFGRGALGAPNAYAQVGDDANGALVSAGHGTAADTRLTLKSLGTGDVRLQNGSGTDALIIDQYGNWKFGGSVTTPTNQAVIGLSVVGVVPTGTPTNGGWLYCQGGALLYKGSSGTVTTVALA